MLTCRLLVFRESLNFLSLSDAGLFDPILKKNQNIYLPVICL